MSAIQDISVGIGRAVRGGAAALLALLVLSPGAATANPQAAPQAQAPQAQAVQAQAVQLAQNDPPPPGYQRRQEAQGQSGAQAPAAPSYHWIRNRWKPEQFLHVERPRLEAGPIERGWWSAMWTIERVPGTNFVRLHNRWKPDQFLHIEHGALQSGPIERGWHSAMWTLEPADANSHRIRNRWKSDQFIHVEFGRVAAGPIERGWWSAMWYFPRP